MVFDAQNEDLFEETKMSFGDHLEELRVVLVRALIGLTIGFLIALLVANKVVTFLQTPLKEAITDFTLERAREDLKEANNDIIPPEIAPKLTEDRLTPKQLKVDPAVVLTLIAPYMGDDAIATLDLHKPYAIRLDQIKSGKTVELCQYLESAGRGEATPQAERIWELMSESDLAIIGRISVKDEADLADRVALLEVLNRIAEDTELYASDAFADIYKGKVDRGGWLSWFTSYFDENDERSLALQSFRDRLKKDDDPQLRRRLNNWIMSLSLHEYVNEPIIELDEIQVWESTEINPQALNAHEVFMIYIKAALIIGLLISSPWIFYQVWTFVAAGLYPHERNYVYIYVPFSIALFFGGAALAFFFVFKPVLAFLFSFNASMGIDPIPRIGEWLSFVMFLPVGFGVAFQLPLVMLFINRLGLVSIQLYLDKWRIAVLVIFFLAMLLTPADPISMILLAFPLTILYFLGIGLCKWMPRGRNPFSEAYEPT